MFFAYLFILIVYSVYLISFFSMKLFLSVLLYIVIVSILTHDYIAHLISFLIMIFLFCLKRVLLGPVYFLFEFY